MKQFMMVALVATGCTAFGAQRQPAITESLTPQGLLQVSTQRIAQKQEEYRRERASEKKRRTLVLGAGVIGGITAGVYALKYLNGPGAQPIPAEAQADHAVAQEIDPVALQNQHILYYMSWKHLVLQSCVIPFVTVLLNESVEFVKGIGTKLLGKKKFTRETMLQEYLRYFFHNLEIIFERYNAFGDVCYKDLLIGAYNDVVLGLEAMIGFKYSQAEYLTGQEHALCLSQTRLYSHIIMALEALRPCLVVDLQVQRTAPLFSPDTQQKFRTLKLLVGQAMVEGGHENIPLQ